MNRRGRSLNRFYPDDYGRTHKSWIPHGRTHTRERSLRHLSFGEIGKGFKMEDGHWRRSFRSRDLDEDEDRSHTSNYDRRIGYEKTYDEKYKDRGQDGDRREQSLKTDWNVDEKKASGEGELLFKYEKWMSDKGWIRTYEGDWERSRVELNGFRWEKAKYYEKYKEWESDDDWRETNRGRSRYRTSKINPRSHGYMPGPKENWYRFKEQDSFLEGQRSSSANHSRVNQRNRYSIANKFISKVSSDTDYSPNERDRSPMKKVAHQVKRSNSRENSSNRRAFTPNSNCSISDEGLQSASQFQECHAVKIETNSTRNHRDTSSFKSGESSPRSKPRSRLKSQIGFISSESLRRPWEKRGGISRPCDFYQRGACKFPKWHVDRSGCCRLHVCAFCFSKDYELVKRGTPVLNFHMEKDCPRYVANIKLKRTQFRTKSLDRCHRNKEDQRPQKGRDTSPDDDPKKDRDNSRGIIKPRCKSLDRRFGKNGESNKPKLDIEMSNIEITVYNHSSKDPREDYLEDTVQSKKVTTENTINDKEKIEESTDSETDGSQSCSDTDDESKESTDDSRNSSEESDATKSESRDSDQQDRIRLLKAASKDLSKLNDGSKAQEDFQKQKKERAKVLVSGLNHEVSQDDIYSLFSTVGRLEEAKLLGNGKAEVVFTKKGHALLAIEEFDNKCLDGKLINCSLKTSSPVYKEGQSQPEEKHKKGIECSEQSRIDQHAIENINLTENQKNNKKKTEKGFNVEGSDVNNRNKVHEDTIELNISQDLFESASMRNLAPEEKMEESD